MLGSTILITQNKGDDCYYNHGDWSINVLIDSKYWAAGSPNYYFVEMEMVTVVSVGHNRVL